MTAVRHSWDIPDTRPSGRCERLGMEGTMQRRRVARYMVAGTKYGRKYPYPRSIRCGDQERVEAAGWRNVPKVDLVGAAAILYKLDASGYGAEGRGRCDLISWCPSPMRQIHGRGLYSVRFYTGAILLIIKTLEK